ncbi:MAG TPA: hypothetical protein VFT22_09160 [Kofleriaceae bacterium]|nr:hypothetical protein [Kofleriaceae bacterium]
MRRLLLVSWLGPLVAPALVAWGAATVHASPRTDPTTGRAVFTGVTMPHATSIALAPAALGLGDVDEVYLAITGAIDQLHIDAAPLDAGPLQMPGARVRDVDLSPGAMVALIYHLAGDRGTLGFEARTNPPESFPSGPSALRYHTAGGGQRDWLASVAASIKITNELYFGASLSHQNTFLHLRYARDTALESGLTDATGRGIGGECGDGGPCSLADPRATELYDVDVRSPILSTSNLRVNVGGMYALARDMWIGVAYHTPPGFSVQTELTGHVDVTRAPRDVTADSPSVLHGQSVVEIQLPASVDAEFRARLPRQLDLHLAGRWEDLSRLSAYDVRTFGTTLPRNGIPEWTERPRGLHDSFAVWGGVEQVDSGPPHMMYGARIGFETSSVTSDRISPITVAPASFTLDLGARRRTASGITLELSYGLSYFPAVSGGTAFDPMDRIRCIDSGFDHSTPACEAVRDGYAIPSVSGSYERFQHAFRIGLRYAIP